MKKYFAILVAVCLVSVLGLASSGSRKANGAKRAGQVVRIEASGTAVGFLAKLSPANEVPPVTNADSAGSGEGAFILTVQKDSSGAITSATGEFIVKLSGFPTTDNVILMHIHSGGAGQSGAPVVDAGLGSQPPIPLTSGSANLVVAGVSVSPTVAQNIISAPGSFYLNVHTTMSPGGAGRDQLTAATTNVTQLAAHLAAGNEVTAPAAVDANASGQANVTLTAVVDSSGTTQFSTADLAFTLNNLGTDPVILSHIHQAAKGANGAVVVPSNITPASPLMPNSSGTVTFTQTGISIDPALLAQIAGTPSGFYYNVHTQATPAGAARGQLEVPPIITGVAAQGKSIIVTGTTLGGGQVQVNGTGVVTKSSGGSTTQLTGKKALRGVAHGQTITVTVVASDGVVSNQASFTRP